MPSTRAWSTPTCTTGTSWQPIASRGWRSTPSLWPRTRLSPSRPRCGTDGTKPSPAATCDGTCAVASRSSVRLPASTRNEHDPGRSCGRYRWRYGLPRTMTPASSRRRSRSSRRCSRTDLRASPPIVAHEVPRVRARGSGRWSWLEVRLDVGVGQVLGDRHLDVVGQVMTPFDRPFAGNEDGQRDEAVPPGLTGAQVGEVDLHCSHSVEHRVHLCLL